MRTYFCRWARKSADVRTGRGRSKMIRNSNTGPKNKYQKCIFLCHRQVLNPEIFERLRNARKNQQIKEEQPNLENNFWRNYKTLWINFFRRKRRKSCICEYSKGRGWPKIIINGKPDHGPQKEYNLITLNNVSVGEDSIPKTYKEGIQKTLRIILSAVEARGKSYNYK